MSWRQKGVRSQATTMLTIQYITATSNDRHGVSNYQPIECLFNSLFKLTSKKHQRSALLSLCEEKLLWPVVSLHKGTEIFLIDWHLFPLIQTRSTIIWTHNMKQNQWKTMWIGTTKITQWKRNRTKALSVFTSGVFNEVQWVYIHNIHTNMTTHIDMFMGIYIHSHIHIPCACPYGLYYAVPSDPIQMQSVILKFKLVS